MCPLPICAQFPGCDQDRVHRAAFWKEVRGAVPSRLAGSRTGKAAGRQTEGRAGGAQEAAKGGGDR